MPVHNTVTFTPVQGSSQIEFSVVVTADTADWIDRKWSNDEDLIIDDTLGRRHRVARKEYQSVGFGGMFIVE